MWQFIKTVICKANMMHWPQYIGSNNGVAIYRCMNCGRTR